MKKIKQIKTQLFRYKCIMRTVTCTILYVYTNPHVYNIIVMGGGNIFNDKVFEKRKSIWGNKVAGKNNNEFVISFRSRGAHDGPFTCCLALAYLKFQRFSLNL